jgi:ribonuclease HI
MSTRVEFECTNNQIEYEALLNGLKMLHDMGADKVEIYGDSRLVVEQVNGLSQCLDMMLNEYCERCLEVLRKFREYNVKHVPRGDNERASKLAQQASRYDIRRGKFATWQRPALHAIFAGEVLMIWPMVVGQWIEIGGKN